MSEPTINTVSSSFLFCWVTLIEDPGYPLSYISVDIPEVVRSAGLTVESFSGWYQFNSEIDGHGMFYYEVHLTCAEFPFLNYKTHGHTYFVETARARVEYHVSLFLEAVKTYVDRVRINQEAIALGVDPLPIPDPCHARRSRGEEGSELALADKAEPLSRADTPTQSPEYVAYKASQETLSGCLFLTAVCLIAIITGLALGWVVFDHLIGA